ncbi:hypothetical protein CHUAL_010673 [Chamberlinius hualienensis]
MAEVVDLIREYSKEFIMYPINERFNKMENYFKQKLEQMEKLINGNIHKTNTMESIQSNNFKNVKEIQTNFHDRLTQLEGKSEFIYDTNEEKHQDFNKKFINKEIQLNGIINHFEESLKKLSKDLSEFESEVNNKNKQLAESVQQMKIESQELNENIEGIQTILPKNIPLLNKEIDKVKTRLVDVTDNLQDEIDSQFQQLKNKQEDNSKKIEEMEEKSKIAKEANLLELNSMKNVCEEERKKMIEVLFTAVASMDEQQKTIECLRNDITGQWTNLKKMWKLSFLIGEFHEEKISSYIASTSSSDFKWEISGIKKMIQEESRLMSPSFELKKYQVKVHLEFAIILSTVSLRLMFEEQDSELFKVKPAVTCILKDLSGNKRPIITRLDVYYGNNIYYGPGLCTVSLLDEYVMNDTITINFYFDPPEISNSYISTNGLLRWKITNYQQKKQNAIDRLIDYEPSPYFLTSPNGYRVMVKMWLNGYGDYKGKGLSVEVAFLPGEHDSTLSNSFPHKTTVILFNKLDSSKNYWKTVDINNEHWYSIHILPHNEIENDGFVKDDYLLMKVIVELKGTITDLDIKSLSNQLTSKS